MFIKKTRHVVLMAAVVVLLTPSVQAASTITIAASPAVASVVNDMINDFIGVTDGLPNANGGTGLGYTVSLQVITDKEAEAAIVAANQAGGDPSQLPDLFLSQSVDAPNRLISQGLTLDGQLIKFANDSLVLYSSGDKQLNLQGIGPLDFTQLGNIKIALPNYTLKVNDPYSLSVKRLIGPLLNSLKNSHNLVITPDMVSSYAAVEVVALADGGADYGFTGLSQICSANDGIRAFEPGAQQFIFPPRFDVQLGGVKIANNFNLPASPTYNPAQSQELVDFVSFLNGTPLALGAITGKNTLAQHCYH